MKKVCQYILFFVFAALNINAVNPRPLVRQGPSQAELAQSILTTLRQNKLKFIEQKNKKIEDQQKVISIYDRLIFALNARYKNGDVVEFLSESCLAIAEQEQKEKRPLVQFYAHLSEVIKNAQTERDDIGLTIENYIHSAPVHEPLTAARFILNNSYSNGQNGQKAAGLNRDELAPNEPVALEVQKVSDFEFSGEIEDWFARNVMTESTDSETSAPDSEKTQPLESPKPEHDKSAPNDTPVLNSSTPPPQAEHSQTTTALTSEPKPETN